MIAFFFTRRTAPTGQSLTQNPHPVHFSTSTIIWLPRQGFWMNREYDLYKRFSQLLKETGNWKLDNPKGLIWSQRSTLWDSITPIRQSFLSRANQR
jgi:hypothetical protein